MSKATKKRLSATAVGLGVFVLAAFLFWTGLLTVAELKTLDHRFRIYSNPAAARDDLVLVAIDEASLEHFGRWPWPRDRHGYAVQFLKGAGAKAIVFDILFTEPDQTAAEFDAVFSEEIQAAGNVFLPFILRDRQEAQTQSASHPESAPSQQESTFLSKAALPVEGRPSDDILFQYQGATLPIGPFAEAAHGMGYINLFPDEDGTSRRLPLLARVQGWTVPQISTAVARTVFEVERAGMTNHTLELGPTRVPLTSDYQAVLNWHGTLEEKVYPTYPMGAVLQSFLDLQEGRKPLLDPALFQDKIVFIATTAAGTYELRVTPVSPSAPGVLIHMAALDNLLQGDFLRPIGFWGFGIITLVLCLTTAWSFMLVQRQTLKIGLVLLLAAGYYAVVVYAFTAHHLWLDLALSEGSIGVTFAVAATVEYFTEGRHRRQLRAAFDKYMAADVVDEIMRDPESIKLGGEKKELSVFFSDVAGFTSISESLDPETLVDLLNRYLSAMTDIILQQRGNVNKYLGDGIMAIFGAPRGDPDHATLACYAALESQAALTRLREEWESQGFPSITARIGINSGPLVVGNMGSQTRMEYTVMGDSVNLASRLEGANKYYDTKILIGPRTFELAQANIEAREVDRMRVKGKHEPVVVYEVLARKGDLAPEKQRVVDCFREGLSLYKQQAFERAKNRFEQALALDPSDGPSQVYQHRSEEYLKSPPPPDWDGVFDLKSK